MLQKWYGYVSMDKSFELLSLSISTALEKTIHIACLFQYVKEPEGGCVYCHGKQLIDPVKQDSQNNDNNNNSNNNNNDNNNDNNYNDISDEEKKKKKNKKKKKVAMFVDTKDSSENENNKNEKNEQSQNNKSESEEKVTINKGHRHKLTWKVFVKRMKAGKSTSMEGFQADFEATNRCLEDAMNQATQYLSTISPFTRIIGVCPIQTSISCHVIVFILT